MRYKIAFFAVLLLSVIDGRANTLKDNFFRSKVVDDDLTVVERLQYYDSLLVDNDKDWDLLYDKGELAFTDGRYELAEECFSRAHSINQDVALAERCRLLRRLMTSRLYVDRYRDCAISALELLSIDKPDSLKYYDIRAYSALIDILTALKTMGVDDNGLRDRYIDRTVALAENVDNFPPEEQRGITSLSHLLRMFQWTESGDLRQGLDEAKLALRYADDPVVICGIKGTTALLYEAMGENEIAEEYYSKLFAAPVSHLHMTILMSNYLNFLSRQGRIEEVLTFCDSNRRYMRMGNLSSQCGIMRTKSDALYRTGQYADAYVTLDSAMTLMDGLRKEINLIDPVLLDAEVSKSICRSNREHTILWYVLLCGLALMAIFTVGWMIYRRRGHTDYDDTGNESLSCNVHDLEPTPLSVDMIRRNYVLTEIGRIVDRQDIQADEQIRMVARQLKKIDINGDAWEPFRIYFDRIHPSFFVTLCHRHPSLSSTECRLCAFMVMDMTTKEIARMTNRSPRTVEALKYRLRKKLNLADDVPTIVYLRQLL